MSNTKSIPVSFRLTESEHAAIVRISGEDAAKSLSETVKALVLEGLAERLSGEKNFQLAAQVAELREVLLETQASQFAYLIHFIKGGNKLAESKEHLDKCFEAVGPWRQGFERRRLSEPDGN